MKKIYYNKLIRDKIPEKIRSLGEECETYELSKKVGEEATGLLNAKNKKEIIEELADVMAVIEEILKVKKITKHELVGQQEKNFEKKGGFEKKLFLIWSSDGKYKTNEKKGEIRKVKK